MTANGPMRAALEIFAADESWLRNGTCDPNSGRFQGKQIAIDALAAAPSADMPRDVRWCDFCSSWHSKPCSDGCRWTPSGLTVEQLRALEDQKQTSNEVRRREDIFRSALLDIKAAHVPDQPAYSQADETTWVMQHVGDIRRIASKALEESSTTPPPTKGEPSQVLDGYSSLLDAINHILSVYQAALRQNQPNPQQNQGQGEEPD